MNSKTQPSWPDDPQKALSFFIQHFLSFTSDIAQQAEEFITYDGASSPIRSSSRSRPSSRNSSRPSSPSPLKINNPNLDVTLTICTQCERVVRQKVSHSHSIRISREEDDVKWTTLQEYLRTHPHLEDGKNFKFSHGLCFSCFRRESESLDSTTVPAVGTSINNESASSANISTEQQTTTTVTATSTDEDLNRAQSTTSSSVHKAACLLSRCNSAPDLLLPQPTPSSPTSFAPPPAPLSLSATVSPIEPRVLVVDDNRLQRNIHQRMVIKAGFQCDTAEDGHEAVKMLKAKAYSLVLMDCVMGETDGWSTTQVIRQLEGDSSILSSNARQSLAVVALTGLALDTALVLKCTDAGMDDVVHKPITPSAMKQLLETAHSGRSRSSGSLRY